MKKFHSKNEVTFVGIAIVRQTLRIAIVAFACSIVAFVVDIVVEGSAAGIVAYLLGNCMVMVSLMKWFVRVVIAQS